MKRFLILSLILCSTLSVMAEEDVYLDLKSSEIQQYKTFSADLATPKEDYTKGNREKIPFQYVNEESNNLYSKKTVTDKKEKRFGKAKVGAKYDTTVTPDSLSQKRTLYTDYDLTKKMKVGADYQTNSLGGKSAQTKGTVGIGPEYQLNSKIKLKNKYSKNLSDDSNKSEVSVEYKPFKDGRMDFNAGAAEIQRDNSGGGSSQVNFGTNFRF